MKRIIYIITALAMTACVNDLDTLPLNKTEPVSEYVYGTDENAYLSGLSRLYFQFVSNELTDLQLMDGGASEIIRAFWSVQETTADAAKCSWENDAWVRALNTNTWSEVQNDAVYAVYVRTLQGIAFVNEYLRQTAPDKLSSRGVQPELAAKIDGFRAEARFIRAYLYWMALDCFGSVPFTTEKSPFGGTYFPEQATRADIFDYCVSELTYLISDRSHMPEPRFNYPRADKGSAAGLLARMYLNSKVYTGVERWAEAKAVCEGIFGMGYTLCPDYAALFRGDNGENLQARGEMLWTVDYNAEKTQSYGGSSYILSATLASTDITDESRPNGQRNGWAGLRVPYEFVSRYYVVGSVLCRSSDLYWNRSFRTVCYIGKCQSEYGSLFTDFRRSTEKRYGRLQRELFLTGNQDKCSSENIYYTFHILLSFSCSIPSGLSLNLSIDAPSLLCYNPQI